MKATVTALAIICTFSSLFAQTTNPVSVTPKAGTGVTSGAKTIKLLNPAEKENWKEQLGEWKFDGEKLTGTGASGIIYNRSFKTPFQITFGFEMLEGTRPAISGFGRYSVMTEGVGNHLAIFPAVPKGGCFQV
ncbi:MAG: hypothetical protein JWL59_3092 [Chthoniobacteraceae bacterium]|nr:hypothetical protein [Chthoniobacteraceae bacterium]